LYDWGAHESHFLHNTEKVKTDLHCIKIRQKVIPVRDVATKCRP